MRGSPQLMARTWLLSVTFPDLSPVASALVLLFVLFVDKILTFLSLPCPLTLLLLTLSLLGK